MSNSRLQLLRPYSAEVSEQWAQKSLLLKYVEARAKNSKEAEKHLDDLFQKNVKREQLINWLNERSQSSPRKRTSNNTAYYSQEFIDEVISLLDVAFQNKEKQRLYDLQKLDLLARIEILQNELQSYLPQTEVKVLLAKLNKLFNQLDASFAQKQPNANHDIAHYQHQYEAILDEHTEQAGYSRIAAKNKINSNKNSASPCELVYRYTYHKDELVRLSLRHSQNIGLSYAARDDFFEQGEGGVRQIKADCLRNYTVQGKPRLGLHSTVSDIADEQVYAQLRKLLGDSQAIESLIQAHSQGPGGQVGFIMGHSIPQSDDGEIAINAPDTYTCNIFKDQENGQFYMRVFFQECVIKSNKGDKDKQIGVIPGPIEAFYQLVKKQDQNREEKWGFELITIETDNKDVAKIICGKLFAEAEIIKKYSQPRAWLAYESRKFSELLNVHRGTPLYEVGKAMQQRVHELASESPDDEVQVLARHLALNNNALQRPSEASIIALEKHANTLKLKPSRGWQVLGMMTMTFATGLGFVCGVVTAVSSLVTATGPGAIVGLPGLAVGVTGGLSAVGLYKLGGGFFNHGCEKNIQQESSEFSNHLRACTQVRSRL